VPPEALDRANSQQTVIPLAFSEGKAQVIVHNTLNQSIFLVKINKSSKPINAAQTGAVYPLARQHSSGRLLQENGDETKISPVEPRISRREHEKAQSFNENPPRIEALRIPARTIYSEPVNSANRRTFWVEKDNGWRLIGARVYARSERCVVWCADEEAETVSKAQCADLAKRFDRIYRYVTGIFGYEYGSADGGGIDGDKAIHILIYDIDADQSPEQTSGVVGFFWAKDSYTQENLNQSGLETIKTNRAEMFYLDSFFMRNNPNLAYSTVVHELQHMINFNEKKVNKGLSSARWYNEMLSLMAEDIIDPLLGITIEDIGHPVRMRMPYFLSVYNGVSLTEWLSGDEALVSYATVFAFGAYLARNFGGADLLYEIAHNDAVDIPSLSLAISAVNDGQTFEQALVRYGEALVFSGADRPADVFSFDRTVTSMRGDIEYTVSGFDIWNMKNASGFKGPVIFNIEEEQPDLDSYSLLVQTCNTWQNITGDITTTIVEPASNAVELYLMIK
jgi:hypothetical protein